MNMDEHGEETDCGAVMRESLAFLLHRRPFKPFRIILANGDRYEVAAPRAIALGQTQLTVYAPRSDRFSVLRLNQLAALEVIGQAA